MTSTTRTSALLPRMPVASAEEDPASSPPAFRPSSLLLLLPWLPFSHLPILLISLPTCHPWTPPTAPRELPRRAQLRIPAAAHRTRPLLNVTTSLSTGLTCGMIL